MKPRLRLHRGRWLCGLLDQHPMWWAVAFTPEEAYVLWWRVQPMTTDAAAVSAAEL